MLPAFFRLIGRIFFRQIFIEWRETPGIQPPSPSALFGSRWSRRTSRRPQRLRERTMWQAEEFPATPKK